MSIIACNPTPINKFCETPTYKKIVQWVTVRHPEGGVASYPMFSAPEGLAWLEMRETLRPEDTIIAVTPCIDQFFVIESHGNLNMGTTLEEAQAWAEE
jgi:hypothetical protein